MPVPSWPVARAVAVYEVLAANDVVGTKVAVRVVVSKVVEPGTAVPPGPVTPSWTLAVVTGRLKVAVTDTVVATEEAPSAGDT
jgi:hypothetical protein